MTNPMTTRPAAIVSRRDFLRTVVVVAALDRFGRRLVAGREGGQAEPLLEE